MNPKQLMSAFKRVPLVLLAFAISFAFFVTPVHADAIHHWTFDSGDVSGADATDVIGGNTATLIDKGNFPTGQNPDPPDGDAEFVLTDGAFGGHLREPDSWDEASLSSTVGFATGEEWTVALWINRRGSGFQDDVLPSNPDYRNPPIISPIGYNIRDNSSEGGNHEQIQLRRNHDESLAWVGTGGNKVRGSVGSGILPADGWVHIAVVSDGSSVTLYRDGIELIPQTHAVTDTSWRINSIGKSTKSAGLSQGADLDEVWVFDEALSACQIYALMNFNDINATSDSDGDGVIDQWDACPVTPAGSYVNSNGCTTVLYTQEELDQELAAKDQIIANKELIIVNLNSTIANLNTQIDDLTAEVSDLNSQITQNEQTITLQATVIDSLVAAILKKSNTDANAADAVKTSALKDIDQAMAEDGKAKEIDKAQKEMAKAKKELYHTKKDGTPDPKYDKAIDHYKKAWKHAQKAMK